MQGTTFMALITSTFGKRVRQLRLKKKLSQERLAELAGLHVTFVGAIERGKRNLSLVTIVKLANPENCSEVSALSSIPHDRDDRLCGLLTGTSVFRNVSPHRYTMLHFVPPSGSSSEQQEVPEKRTNRACVPR